MSSKIKENDIVKVRVDGKELIARVVDLCADSVQVELVKSRQCFICQVSELKFVSNNSTSRTRIQLAGLK